MTLKFVAPFFALGKHRLQVHPTIKTQTPLPRYTDVNIIEKYELDERAIDRIIGMAWEDRTPFEAITAQFGLPEKDVIKLMKQQMKLRNWKKWRARVQGRKTKHRRLGEADPSRFKSRAQRHITGNYITKKKY